MDLAEAARQIVDETSHKAQLGSLDADARAEAESAAAAALSDSIGKSAAAITGIARCLYWKLNPLGTVPPTFYSDDNFARLAERIKAIVGTESPVTPQAESRVPVWPEPSAVEELFRTIDDEPSADGIELDDVAKIDAMAAPKVELPGAVDADALKEFLTKHAYAAVPEADVLGGIQQVLVDFVADLADVFTIKPEWHGREAEAVAAPARTAAQKILDIWSKASKPLPSDADISEIVPKNWTTEIARTLFDRLDSDVVVMWSGSDSREAAIRTVAAKIAARIGRIALIDEAIVRNGFDEPVTIENPGEWAHEVASDVFRMIMADDFRPYSVAIGAASRENSISYIGKSIFENIVPAVAFKAMGTPMRPAPAAEAAPQPSSAAQREPWKMPWSVARKVVDELCSRSGDEKALLAPFGNWLGLPADDIDGIKNELVSEVVIIGREQPVQEEANVTSGPAIRFVYENYAGKIGVRNAIPVRMTFGSNEWHPERQWMMEAFDLEHGAMRTFAAKGIIKFLDGKDTP